MNVSQALAAHVKSLGIDHVFGVVGGGSMYLNDAFREIFIPCHHEQAAAFAADAYARLRGIGCVLVTTGPGGTNAITGCAASWVDSIPVIFISGQVMAKDMIADSGVRQSGLQETNICAVVREFTKKAVVAKRKTAVEEFKHLATFAKATRSGPIWFDVPLDVQSASI